MGSLLRWLEKAARHPIGIGLGILFTFAVGISELTGFNARSLSDYWNVATKEKLTEQTRLALGQRLRDLARDGSLSVDESQSLRSFAAGLNLETRAADQYLAELEPRVIRAVRAIGEGAELAAHRRYSEAKSCFQDAITSDDQNPVAWASFGGAALELGATDEAEAALRKALALDPDSIEANYNFGACLAQKSQKTAALDHLERALALVGRPNGSLTINRKTLLVDLQRSPHFSSLRTLPRFGALIQQAQNASR
jgi:tetratricopeptide (TPR) repeat protein